MTAEISVTTSDEGKAAGAFPYRVLLGPPTTRTIPIFGLQANAGRPDSEVWSISTKDESGQLDKQAAGRLRSGRLGDHCYLTTRHKIGLREARYATWLAFKSQDGATAFLTEFPRYGLSNLLANTERRIATIEHDLRQGLAKGRYSLGELDEKDRYRKALLYVRYTNQVRQLKMIAGLLHQLSEATKSVAVDVFSK